jgi:hypothetical protein
MGLVGVLLVGVGPAGSSSDGCMDVGSWSWEWKPAADEIASPKVEICPLKYDKEWAYAVEIDDGPASTLTVAQPLLARFAFTDAPPGLAGGRSCPSSVARR